MSWRKKELYCLCKLKEDVIEKQEGNLAILTPSIVGQTLLVPVHNMFAKYTLGLADYLFSMKSGISR